jgi:hypothetical protein
MLCMIRSFEFSEQENIFCTRGNPDVLIKFDESLPSQWHQWHLHCSWFVVIGGTSTSEPGRGKHNNFLGIRPNKSDRDFLLNQPNVNFSQKQQFNLFVLYYRGEHISRAGRRTGVRIKAVIPKEGILRIDNKNKVLKANSLFPF